VEIGSERGGNCGYAIPLEKIPKKGDRVAVLGQTGMYDVSEIDS